MGLLDLSPAHFSNHLLDRNHGCHEGNEGHEEGYGGNESHEGNEGHEEGHEEACNEGGGRGGGPDEEARNESNEGNEGHEEGNEGDESSEGNEGHEEVIAQYGQRRRSAEMISHGGVPRRALFTVPLLENIQS